MSEDIRDIIIKHNELAYDIAKINLELYKIKMKG